MMLRKIRWSFFLCAVLVVGCDAQDPRLVVVLSVDQMRADYLDRFGPQFTGGFRWLLDEGAVFTDAHQDHAETSTAPGHATIATGVYPSRHGIVGNNFFVRAAGRATYSVADSTHTILGFPDDGGRSPANLLRPALGDWLKEQSPNSKVVSVAIKDRSAILMGGLHPDGAYWYHTGTGRYVTSSYYTESYPAWVDEFNAAGRPVRYYGREWTRLLPEDQYGASREDAFAAERDGIRTTFPHRLAGPEGTPDAGFFASLTATPFSDEVTLAFARDMVVHEALGQDDDPDILFLGLSAADILGHPYGPFSQEVQDYYLRMDLLLGDFFEFLNQQVGADNYVVTLTADHGVLVMPEELSRRGIESARLSTRGLRGVIRDAMEEAIDHGIVERAPDALFGAGVLFDFGPDAHPATTLAHFRRHVAEKMLGHEAIAVALTFDEVAEGAGSGILFERYLRSFHPDRAGDIMFDGPENHLLTSSPTQTSHGSPYNYDSHVPMIFAGPNIPAVRHDGHVQTVDIAPTLAALLGIEAPGDLDGEVLPVVR
jgi:arylsulfatase A-like enzyme